MDKSELIEKLKKMRLPVIAEQYELQSANPEYSQLSFDERFSELIDMEYDSRVNHTIERFMLIFIHYTFMRAGVVYYNW